MFPFTNFFLTHSFRLPLVILSPEATLAEAIAQMAQSGNSFILISSPPIPIDHHSLTLETPPISIFTEKELVKLLAHPSDWSQVAIASVMTPACTVPLTTAQHLPSLLQAFQKADSRYLVIVDQGGQAIGILTADQVLRSLPFNPSSVEENPEKYKSLFENLPIGLAITDLNGDVLEVNQAFKRICQSHSQEDVLQWLKQQKLDLKLTSEPSSFPLLSDSSSDIDSNPHPNSRPDISLEIPLKTTPKNQPTTWFKAAATPLPLTSDSNLVISYVDITPLKQAQAELKHSLSLLQATLESTADGIVSVSLQGEILSFNQKFLEMWRIPESLIQSENPQSWFNHIVGQLQEPEQFAQRVQSLYEKPTIKSNDILKLKNGKVFDRRSLPYKLGDQIIGRVWSFRDITQTVQLEQTLRITAQRERLITRVQTRIRQSLELKHILKTAVREVQKILQAERVVVYQMEGCRTPKFIVEAVQDPNLSIVGASFSNPWAIQTCWQTIAPSDIVAVDDLDNQNLPAYGRDLIQELKVRAYLCVPLMVNQQIWGLLYVQECSRPRCWQEFEQELLRQLSRELAIAIQQSQLYQQLQAANEELQRIASLDSLTQVANRLKFDEYLAAKWRYQSQEPLSLILCDIDCFKTYNDTYGHQAGDDCLRQVAGAIRLALPRSGDLVARYGGEEFAVILPETPAEMALYIAQNIQSLVKDLEILHIRSKVSPYITISSGVATLIPQAANSPADLIAAADRALYQAKQQGRDRVILHPHHPSGKNQPLNSSSHHPG